MCASHHLSINHTLDVILAPGEKTRLSPLVESAQVYFLTNSWPDDRKRYDSIQSILHNQHLLMDKLAKMWVDSHSQHFSEELYRSNLYLQMYAAYYFSVNVGKLQILLSELLYSGEIPEAIHTIDIGVGTGSTAVAMLDFIYAWGTACQLHRQPFPLKEFSLIGYDRSEEALQAAERMVNSYRITLLRRREEIAIGDTVHPMLELLEKILLWSENIIWRRVDINSDPILMDDQANLVVLSNVLNELNIKDTGSCLDRTLSSLQTNALAIVIEPGEQKCSQNLMSWRKEFLQAHPEFSAILPCGQNHPSGKSSSCEKCWSARRESFHQPLLYQEFLRNCNALLDNSHQVNAYQNNLLSWSYSVLKKHPAKTSHESAAYHLVPGTTLEGPVHLRIMGKFHQKSNQRGVTKDGYQLVDYPVDQDPYDVNFRDWEEYLKVCTLPFPEIKSLVIERQQGFYIPRIRFGQEVMVSNLQVQPFKNGINGMLKLTPLPGDLTQIGLNDSSGYVGHPREFLPVYDDQARRAVDELAFRLFGFPRMRAFQHEILSRVLCGKNIFGIAATGGGKSECYILPAMILPGVTVVISPLKSLMTDQYDERLTRRFGLGDLATYINGDVPFKERQARLKRMELGYYKIVYFTPEQLERGFILDCLRRTNESIGIRYLAMDEAHCISQWGHDFRPSYLNITRRLKEYGIQPVIIALTATASKNVRQDICEELNLNPMPVDQGGDVFVYSSNRPEINFSVRVRHTTEEKVSDILDELGKFQLNNRNNLNPGAALVFLPHTGGSPEDVWRYMPTKATSRKGRYSAGVSGFASYLERALSQKVAIYHGKMDNDEQDPSESIKGKPLGNLSGRTRIQEQTSFINSTVTGTDIMVATKGFGMGIDKPNIRLIIHRTPTSNLEAYAQEAGRAGRDGEMATAILYYSPDAPIDRDDEADRKDEKVKSDHHIHEQFLSNKYIRREDVIVMRAFLKQVKHKLALHGRDTSYLYFTSDEVIDYFDSFIHNPTTAGVISPYHWPIFPERKPLSNEFDEHKNILDNGELYQQKSTYINRILAALYRMRPEIDGRIHQAFLESAQETGAKVLRNDSMIFNWKNIIASNAYFGEMLRTRGVTEQDLVDALRADDLILFAQKLNLSLSETAGLLTDIKFSEGHFIGSKWEPTLLDFSWIAAPLCGPAEGINTLQLWRDYAGAHRRANKPEAEKRAKKQNRRTPNLDDWFGWPELTRRTGWEVLTGPAYEADFDQFLEAFMLLHDERERNDRDSYKRLLTDYIGVSENGQISITKSRKECLRSVLLGYLESYEVVVNDNCYSCSSCVPGGDFEHYPIEQREKAIIRMGPDLISLFEEMKSCDAKIPEQANINQFFDRLKEEETTGRSLFNYLAGWTGKLLDEEPDHLTALWLRFDAMIQNIVTLQPEEFFRLSLKLSESLPLQRLDEFLERLGCQQDEFRNEPRYLKVWLRVHQRNGEYKQEADILTQLLTQYEDQTRINSVEIRPYLERLLALQGKQGPVPNETNFRHWRAVYGRISRSYPESLEAYAEVTSTLTWDEILLEVERQKQWTSSIETQAALMISWVKQNSLDTTVPFNNWVNENSNEIRQWPKIALEEIFSLVPDEVIIQSDFLLDQIFVENKSKDRVIAIGLKRLSTAKHLSVKQYAQLGKLFTSRELFQTALETYITDPDNHTNILRKIIPYLRIMEWEQFGQWEAFFLHHNVPLVEIEIFTVNTIEWVASLPESKQGKAVFGLSPLLLKYMHNEQVIEAIIKYWSPIYLDFPLFLGHFLQTLYHNEIPAAYLADPLLDKTLKKTTDILLEVPVNIGYERWKNAIIMMKKIDGYIEYIKANPGTHRLEYKHLKFLRDSFAWEKDETEADMLSAILLELHGKISSGWKSITVVLLEILVNTGRSDKAKEIAKDQTDLAFNLWGQKVDFQVYLSSMHVAPRTKPIPADFAIIAQNALARF